MSTIAIERTNKGLPAAWEFGGGKTNTGVAVVWAGRLYGRMSPIFVRTKGPLANENHALFKGPVLSLPGPALCRRTRMRES